MRVRPGRVAVLIAVLSLFLGAWLVFDGSRKLLTGFYTWENPAGQGLGPWANIVSALGINPNDMALPFVLLGLLWLVNGVIVLLGTSGSYERTMVASALTLFYLTPGTLVSLTTLILSFRERRRATLDK